MREFVEEKNIDLAFDELEYKMVNILSKKGLGTFSSIHEILGVTTEEYYEFVESVHKKDHGNIKQELLDIAVACVFGVACMEQRSLEW